MSNEWDINEGTDSAELNGPGPLRDAYKKQKAANEELMKRLEALEAVNTRNTAADLLEAAGAKRSIAKHYSGPADTEHVNSWLSDFRDALGVAQPTASTTDPALPVETQAQYERMTQAGANGEVTGNMEAASGALSSANSTDDLIAALARLQG